MFFILEALDLNPTGPEIVFLAPCVFMYIYIYNIYICLDIRQQKKNCKCCHLLMVPATPESTPQALNNDGTCGSFSLSSG